MAAAVCDSVGRRETGSAVGCLPAEPPNPALSVQFLRSCQDVRKVYTACGPAVSQIVAATSSYHRFISLVLHLGTKDIWLVAPRFEP